MHSKYYTNIFSKPVFALILLIPIVFIAEIFGIPNNYLSDAQTVTILIVLIAATFWVTEWIPMYIVSFLILALELLWLSPKLVLEENNFDDSIFYTAFFSNIILLFIGGFVLSKLMQKYGLDKYFAHKILKQTKGNPAKTLLGVILSCSLLSMWMSNTATAAMMLSIILPIVKDIPHERSFRKALILSIPFACNIGGLGTPIGTPPNAIAITYLAQHGIQISFLQWMIIALPLASISLLLLWVLLLKIYPPNDTQLNIEHDKDNFGKKQYLVLSIFIITSIGWLSADFIGVKTGTIALLPIILCFSLKLLDQSDFTSLPWDIIYLICGGLALGIAINSSDLNEVIISNMPSEATTWLFIIIFTLIAIVMSTIMSNTATAALIIPIALSLDLNALSLIYLITMIALVCSTTMILPVTTPPNAIAFGSREIKLKDMILTGSIVTLSVYMLTIMVIPKYISILNKFLFSW